jgi:hypothetical protein
VGQQQRLHELEALVSDYSRHKCPVAQADGMAQCLPGCIVEYH